VKQRIISAIVAFIIVIPLTLLGGLYFKVFVFALGICSLYEMMKARKRLPSNMKYIVYLLFTILFLNNFDLVDVTYYLNIKLIMLSLLCLLLPLLIYHDNDKYNIEDAFYLFGTTMFLSMAFNIIVNIRDEGLMLLIYILLITITTDTFAYFFGIKYGKHKLIPSVSPKKSVEGLLFGTFVGTIIASGFYYYFVSSSNILITILFTFLLTYVGQFGDLVFSSIKRYYNIKDFSNIMPGHGGILDRLDSIIFVSIVYVYMIGLF